MSHVLEARKQFIQRMERMYSNAEQLTTKKMSVEQFQKSFPETDFNVITNDVMKGYITEVIQNVKKSEDKELLQKSATEINSFESVLVEATNGVQKRFYVKKLTDEQKIEKSAKLDKVKSAEEKDKNKEYKFHEKAFERDGKKGYDNSKKGGLTKEDHKSIAEFHRNEMKNANEGSNLYSFHKNTAEEHEKLAKGEGY